MAATKDVLLRLDPMLVRRAGAVAALRGQTRQQFMAEAIESSVSGYVDDALLQLRDDSDQ